MRLALRCRRSDELGEEQSGKGEDSMGGFESVCLPARSMEYMCKTSPSYENSRRYTFE
jgi:hypothetical protein